MQNHTYANVALAIYLYATHPVHSGIMVSRVSGCNETTQVSDQITGVLVTLVCTTMQSVLLSRVI